jgi:TonB family protein
VISSQPGSKIGLPSSGDKGNLALSPAGGDKPGLGGAGGGTSIGRGDGPGSGMNGAGTGAGKSGPGRGSDARARSGISPTAGPGGAGNEVSGTPPVPGVDIRGGSTQVTIPAFGDSPANNPTAPGRSAVQQRQALDVDIVATANSGGAFEPYKNLLHGEKHTIYPNTTAGLVVMEYADEAAPGRAYAGPLLAPSAIRTDLPGNLPRARMVVSCVLDVSGNLKNARVLEAGPADMTAKVLVALRSWKFQPAMRGSQPVEVTAILGFGIDTNDRF